MGRIISIDDNPIVGSGEGDFYAPADVMAGVPDESAPSAFSTYDDGLTADDSIQPSNETLKVLEIISESFAEIEDVFVEAFTKKFEKIQFSAKPVAPKDDHLLEKVDHLIVENLKLQKSNQSLNHAIWELEKTIQTFRGVNFDAPVQKKGLIRRFFAWFF